MKPHSEFKFKTVEKGKIVGIGLTVFAVQMTSVWSDSRPAVVMPSVPNDYPTRKPVLSPLKVERLKESPNNLIESFENNPNFANGALVYANEIAIKGFPEYQKILGLQPFTNSSNSSNEVYRVITPTGVVFDPQFSPDGQQVLFKSGQPYETHGKYSLYLWDLKTRQVQAGPPLRDPETNDFLSYRKTSWSPNGDYVAYIRGGDADGYEYSAKYPLKLYVYEIASQKSYFIAQNRALKDVTWSNDNTLLFSMVSQTKSKEDMSTTIPSGDTVGKPFEESAIYEAFPKGGEANLLIRNGCNPNPSPDGRQIIFDDTGPSATTTERRICLFDRLTKTRLEFPIRPANIIKWTSNGQKVIAIKVAQNDRQSKADIYIYDINSISEKSVATIEASDFDLIRRAPTDEQFQIMSITNRDVLFIKVSEMTGIDTTFNMYNQVTSVKAIDLNSGAVTTVAKIKTPLGVDLHGKS